MDSPTDTLLTLLMAVFWTVVGAAIALGIAWKMHKNRRRRERRNTAREARRKFHEWRQASAPNSKT